MRAELYADSRDEWKWSVVIRHAQQSGQSLFWVVMLRPTANQHGNDRGIVEGALPEVTSFFTQESGATMTKVSQRACRESRIFARKWE